MVNPLLISGQTISQTPTSTHGEAVGETAGDTEAVGRTVDGGEDEDHGGAPAKSHQLFSGT